MSDNVLELYDVVVEYDGRVVLDVPYLAVRRGEILTLLGRNGSGKTTLLRLFGLLVRPTRGRLLLDGEGVDFSNTRHLLDLRRRLAAVMQEPLLCRMSVKRNVGLGLRFRSVPKSQIEQKVGAWMERLSISHLIDRSASTLSGGEAQRVSLARAMVLDPEVLFLDEPFAALDAPTRQNQIQEFQTVLTESGVTAVFATHDRSEALALGDRLAVLMDGRIAQLGLTETVFSRPQDVQVARFLGVDTLISGLVTGAENGLVHVDCGTAQIVAEVDRVPGREVYVAVRPEEVDLFAQDDADATLARNTLQGVVTKVVPTETHHRVEIDCGTRVVAVVSRERVRNLALEPGKPVQVTFSARAAHLIGASVD